MKWNEIFRTRKLLKRLISMSLCIGMAGSQLLSGIPIQAEEQTDQTAYNLPDDPVINPSITIQHYYNFPAMVLGNVEDEYNNGLVNYNTEKTDQVSGKGVDAYNSSANSNDLQEYLSGTWSYSTNGKPLVVWNTNIRHGALPSNIDPNLAYGTKRNLDPKSRIRFSDPTRGEVMTQSILYKMFADERVPFLLKPQMRYMNKLYNAASEDSYNPNYTLSEVWLKKDNNNVNSINRNDFLIIKTPRLETDSTRHDPSKFIFTNNAENANIKKGKLSHGVQYHIEGNEDNPDQVTVLVSEDIVIRLVFEPTKGTAEVKNVDFFDYDITDGKIYATKAEAESRTNPIKEKEEGETIQKTYEDKYPSKDVWVNTKAQGINSYSKNAGNNSFLAFGNANGYTSLENIKWKNKKINQSNLDNRFGRGTWGEGPRYNGSNLQGATFDLVTGMDPVTRTLQWSDGIRAPALFSTDPEVDSNGRTVYAHGSVESFTLGFERWS